jgi:hypothetical protein
VQAKDRRIAQLQLGQKEAKLAHKNEVIADWWRRTSGQKKPVGNSETKVLRLAGPLRQSHEHNALVPREPQPRIPSLATADHVRHGFRARRLF